MSDKDLYISSFNELDVPIFSQPWWLNIVAGNDNWDVVAISKDSKIVAILPYVLTRQFYFNLIVNPPLTPYMGPIIMSSGAKYAKKLSQEKDFIYDLVDMLPKHSYFSQKINTDNTNCLPFFWKGFTLTTRYTYILKLTSDHDFLWQGLLPKIRTDIKKASNKFSLELVESPSSEQFISLVELVYKRQNKKLPYSKDILSRLITQSLARQQGKVFMVKDAECNNHAGVFIVWDNDRAYYLVGGADPSLRNSGATSLCLWEAIKYCSSFLNTFDFEGSMIEPIERYFRAFGAQQVTYQKVSKNNSLSLKIAKFIKN